jgi:hypothetical protein
MVTVATFVNAGTGDGASLRSEEEVSVFVRRILASVVGLACVALLSSCALLPPGTTGNEQQQADAAMHHIADALKDHDAAALKKLFSTTAREKATDLDGGVKYLFSVFPSGLKTWTIEDGAPGSAEEQSGGKQTEELFATYKGSADGKEYDLYFTDFTVNQTNDIGIYSLGVVPHNPNGDFTASGKRTPFGAWKATFTPGVYVPKK